MAETQELGLADLIGQDRLVALESRVTDEVTEPAAEKIRALATEFGLTPRVVGDLAATHLATATDDDA